MIRGSLSPNDENPDTLSEERRIRLCAAERVRLEALDRLESRTKSRQRVLAGLVLLISGLLAAVVFGPGFQDRLASMRRAAASALEESGGIDHYRAAIERWGPPDRVLSDEDDSPGPPDGARIVYYDRENLYLTFLPRDGQDGSPGQLGGWRISGITDTRTRRPVSIEEAIRRLEGRAR